ncbi:MAG: tRNA preQ1(34) S-adenosylmethionine ribosyltransferase-isomerase QueA, partial [Planctomycetota bacterium]
MPTSFPIHELDYDLPAELIAQEPLAERHASRLLVLDRTTSAFTDETFRDLPQHLESPDLLVLNDTRVIPARFLVRRSTGGRLDGLYLQELEPGAWEVLLNGSSRLRPGESLTVEPHHAGVSMELETRIEGGRWRVRVSPAEAAVQILSRTGQPPLPPYIRRPKHPDPGQLALDRARYQTVYAERPGAVAAPTAGLHFSSELLTGLRKQGVETTSVTLHVGMGTFAPIQVDDLRDHAMHSEQYDLPPETASAIALCRKRSGRVVAVGTTSLRVLESCADDDQPVRARQGSTDLFCYPPFRFRVVDAL